jgi:hypothetical protein
MDVPQLGSAFLSVKKSAVAILPDFGLACHALCIVRLLVLHFLANGTGLTSTKVLQFCPFAGAFQNCFAVPALRGPTHRSTKEKRHDDDRTARLLRWNPTIQSAP